MKTCSVEGCSNNAIARSLCQKHYGALRKSCEKLPSLYQYKLASSSPTDIAWLAGLLEGEGCFSTAIKHGKDKTSRYSQITLGMTDEDVVAKVQRVTGMGNLRKRPPSKAGLGKKDVWWWSVGARPEVLAIIKAILPYMGQRRTEAINKMVAPA